MEELDGLKNILRALAGVPGKDLSVLDKLCAIKHYKKNDFFLQSGAIPKYAAFVVKGAFREFYTDEQGREFNKAFSFKGELTGSYYDLNLGKPSAITIEALTDSTVIRLLQKDFDRLIKSDDAFWVKAAHRFTHQLLMRKFEKEYQLLTLSAAERYDLLQQQYPELEQLVPAYHIASYLGITPISLSRIRAQKRK